MSNPDRAMPNWINKWLMINTGVLIIDGSFCVLRPHSLPDGCLGSTIFYTYKWYIEADKHYGDPTDSFIFTQGFGNLIEACICLLVLFNVFRSVALRKMVIIFVSVMTSYKTLLYSIYNVDPGLGGRPIGGLVGEFLVFGLGGIWLVVPAYAVWVLLQDFVDIKPRRAVSSSRNYSPRKTNSVDDFVGGNSSASESFTGSRRYNLRNHSTD